jgi:glycosyltransferase involved in cell wall biosynthesis
VRVVLCGPYPLDDDDARHADGTWHAMINLAEPLASFGDVELCVVSRSKRLRRTHRVRRDGMLLVHVPDPFPRLDYLLRRRLVTRAMRREVAAFGPDVVHAQGDVQFLFTALSSSFPAVLTLHSIFETQTRAHGRAAPLAHRVAYHLMRRWERQYLPRVRNLIAINAEIAAAVRARAPAAHIYRIDNPINPAFFDLPDAQTRPVVLFVAQISRRKGLHVLLEAFERIADEDPAYQVRVVGGAAEDPGYQAELRARYAHRVGRSQLTFLGPMRHEELYGEMSRCSVLCLSSFYEASPLVVVEAMAAGKPVVGTRVGDLDAVVEAAGAGCLVPPGDVDALAGALRAVLRDSTLRREMGARGRAAALRRAERTGAARLTVDAYHDILARDRGWRDARAGSHSVIRVAEPTAATTRR